MREGERELRGGVGVEKGLALVCGGSSHCHCIEKRPSHSTQNDETTFSTRT